MLMPGRVQGWPAGTQRAANAAERLLSQAVAWWDVGQYRDGDRFLRNRGTGGELLDLRLGSAAVANSNDPRYLAPEDQGYVYLPGVASNYLSVPDEAALDITGDLDLRVRVAADTLTSATNRVLIAKWGTTGNQRSYMLQLLIGGGLSLFWNPDGTLASNVAVGSTAVIPFGDGEAGWIRATLDVDNGAGGRRITFYTSTDGVTWSQLGDVITQVGTTSIFSGTALCEVGSNTSGVNNLFTGKVYRAQVLSGIDGTTVLDIDCDAITSGSATSFTALTNQTVTVNRSTSGRKSAAVPSRHKGGKPVMLLGSDDFLEVQDNWQHGLLNFNKGQSFTVVCVTRQWDNQPANARVLSKGYFGIGGYGVITTTTTNNFYAFDPVTNQNAASSTRANGAVAVSTGIYNRVTQNIVAYVGATAGTPASLTNDAPSNALPMTIGRESSAANYNDMEFYAAAVFRRVLTPAEITLLSNYFTGRIA